MRGAARRRGVQAVFAAGLLAVAVACAPEASAPTTVDTITFKLDFGGGVMLSSVDYILKGPGAFTKIGTFMVGAQPTISGTFQNLNPGNYMITVKGAANDGLSRCEGSASFTVMMSITAVVQIPLQCSGIAGVSVDFNACPRIESLSALPAEVLVGSSIALALAASDADGGPAPLTATWTAASGSLQNLSASGATFTCTEPGTFMIGVRVSDGFPRPACADTETLTVTCTAVGP